MNINDLADAVSAADDKISRTQAKQIVETLFKAIADAAVRGEEVSLPGFGKFKVQDKPARTARNPSTGEPIQVAASRKLAFQAAKALKDALAR